MQLSTAIIFGLGFSTVLTLVLVPVLLAAPHIYGEMLRRAFGWLMPKLRGTRGGKAGGGGKNAPTGKRTPANEPGEASGPVAEAAE